MSDMAIYQQLQSSGEHIQSNRHWHSLHCGVCDCAYITGMGLGTVASTTNSFGAHCRPFPLVGLILASLSGLLALSTIAYAQVHRFPFYDPLLLRIFRIGALLSISGLGFGIAGVWRSSSVRWHSAVSSFGMLIFWIVAASGE